MVGVQKMSDKIDQVEIINYQGHKKSIMNLHPGVNILKGPNHAGKSAAIRPINWVIRNRPTSDGFISDFADPSEDTRCSISFIDEDWVSRFKNPKKGSNAYSTSKSDEPLDSVKTNVPQEVKDILKMGEENIQSQRERYFFLESTAGSVARKWNSIVGLEIIDETRKKINTIITDCNSELKITKRKIKETEGDLEQYAYVTECEELAAEADRLDKSSVELRDRILRIGDIGNAVSLDRSIIRDNDRWIGLQPIVDEVILLESHKQKAIDERDPLRAILHGIIVEREAIQTCYKWTALSSDVADIAEVSTKASESRSKAVTVRGVYRGIGKERLGVQDAAESLIQLRTRESELLEGVELERAKIKAEEKSKAEFCQECGADKEHWDLGRI